MALIVSGPVLSFKEESRVQILRVYGIGIALLLILVETEFPWLLDKMRVLENWIGRASVQGLLALMTFEFATSLGDSDFDKSIRLYRQVAAYCMLGCAGLYALGGCLCLGVLRSVRYRWRAERLRVERDLEQLERQQDELKAILEGYGKD
ncbi:hypothetical protein CEUSTIGMA_g8872.t1 [Chlamydomonas eustigma]|uniref:Uncharacterized protein n=1 Tax=Chlamydomonas eustigma TaxID=1157962 RepID=A0A250XEU6_9CHLO|nr:hypothetical protein CEUSTIGMA_g8872.t1 [Chlamydomonas eustigma]|eukprot:GAX81442.1 hypothetical protein CEUSTIGMA_g8872.t1 [Chlamydomonas eustigma]